ncbi:MAG TPA: GlxA family transcriptional regulator [Gammaproteobacteria bacterium]|nr:GlxA family transcriptional regulator [Gammaproteobacteria bacterium]
MISDARRHVVFFVYPGFLLLDVSGPLEVFATAEQVVPGSYRFSILSMDGGAVESSAGVSVVTEAADLRAIDTFVVVGDTGLPDRRIAPDKVDFVRSAAARARRTVSVCMGAFLFAASGLLDGRRATTHWLFAPRMQDMFPEVRVEGDRIFLNDGRIWTSAGMTAGIDVALALIEDDLGAGVARKVARMMVVYYRRPGGQMQYSSLLDLDPGSDRIRRVLSFAREHLAKPLPVDQLAEVAHLSVRQFSRAFVAATGLTPAKAVERLRVEAARPLVEEGREPFETIARAVGFVDENRMRQSFVRAYGRSPRALRRSVQAGA